MTVTGNAEDRIGFDVGVGGRVSADGEHLGAVDGRGEASARPERDTKKARDLPAPV